MSVPVSLDALRSALAERASSAYVLTVSDEGRPHAVHAAVHWEGDALIANVGRRSATNATARPDAISLLFPSRSDDDYSLIVDGTAAVTPGEEQWRLAVTPAKAVLHRPAPAPDPDASPCGADCVPILPRPRRSDP